MRLRLRFRWFAFFLIALTTTLYLFGQQPAAPSLPSSRQAVPAGRGGRARRAPAYPPHAQASPAVVAHGKQLFDANCSFCHGSDARGGETGPDLVRAQVVLDDQHGELLAPVIRDGFPTQGMPKFNLSDADVTAIAGYLHSLPLSNRGAPSNLNILVGNAQAGEAYFNAHCTSCHSVTGDLAGIATKYDAKAIQNMVVSGGGGGRGFGRSGPAPPKVLPTTVTVTPASGQTVSGKLDHLSAFEVALTESDGTYRAFSRNGAVPKVVVHDPLQWHIDMLPKWNDTDIHNLTAYLVTLK